MKDLNGLSVYWKEARSYEILDNNNQLELIRLAQNGNIDARNKLIVHNLRLVISIAKNYLKYAYSLDDLIQEGNIELINAINNYDESFKVPFSSYAYSTINYRLLSYTLRNTSIVHLSRRYNEKKVVIFKAIRDYFKYNGVMPTIKEISNLTGIKSEIVRICLNSENVLSIEDLTNRYEDGEYLDKTYNFEEDYLNKEENNYKVNYLLNNSKLRQKQKDVIKYTYGLDGKEEISNNQELAKIFNCTHQNISLIKMTTLYRLSKNNDVKSL